MDSNPGFDEIYGALHGRILRYLTRLVGEAEAQDLAQETFAKVSQALQSFRGESKLETWIYRIATNTALDRLRSSSFEETTQEPALIEPIEKIESIDIWTGQKRLSVEQQAIRGEMSSCVRSVIDRLPESYRTAIILSDLEGLKDSELAEVLGLSISAAKMRLHRARALLKEELSAYCVFYRNEENELTCDRKTEADNG